MKRLLLALLASLWLVSVAVAFVVGMRYGHNLAGQKIALCLAKVGEMRDSRARLADVARRQHCALVRSEPVLRALVPEWGGWWPTGPKEVGIDCR
jgi:hypothetical protein